LPRWSRRMREARKRESPRPIEGNVLGPDLKPPLLPRVTRMEGQTNRGAQLRRARSSTRLRPRLRRASLRLPISPSASATSRRSITTRLLGQRPGEAGANGPAQADVEATLRAHGEGNDAELPRRDVGKGFPAVLDELGDALVFVAAVGTALPDEDRLGGSGTGAFSDADEGASLLAEDAGLGREPEGAVVVGVEAADRRLYLVEQVPSGVVGREFEDLAAGGDEDSAAFVDDEGADGDRRAEGFPAARAGGQAEDAVHVDGHDRRLVCEPSHGHQVHGRAIDLGIPGGQALLVEEAIPIALGVDAIEQSAIAVAGVQSFGAHEDRAIVPDREVAHVVVPRERLVGFELRPVGFSGAAAVEMVEVVAETAGREDLGPVGMEIG